MLRVEPPELSVGHDGPGRQVLFKQADDDRAGDLFRAVAVAFVVLHIERSVPGVDQSQGKRAFAVPGSAQEVIRLGVPATGCSYRFKIKPKLLEHRLKQLIAGLGHGFTPEVLYRPRIDTDQVLIGRFRVFAPGGRLAQAFFQVVVGEEGAIIEKLLGPFRDVVGRPQLVKLRERVALRVGEPSKDPEVLPRRVASADRQYSGTDAGLL